MTQSPSLGLSRIDLELAREPGHPAGDPTDRYTIVAPLDADGRIDPDAWREQRARCVVVRETRSGSSRGHLVHGPGGRWLIQYEDGDEESGFRFHDEPFRNGEYVSIIRDDESHVYRVTGSRRL